MERSVAEVHACFVGDKKKIKQDFFSVSADGPERSVAEAMRYVGYKKKTKNKTIFHFLAGGLSEAQAEARRLIGGHFGCYDWVVVKLCSLPSGTIL